MIKQLKPRLARLGLIKIGGKGEERTAQGGRKWRLPKKLDHFLITTNERTKAGDLIVDKEMMTKCAEVSGQPAEHPKKLDIYLLSDEVEENFQTGYACYMGSTRVCHGDGECAFRRVQKDKGVFSREFYPVKQGNECHDIDKGTTRPTIGIVGGCDPDTCYIYTGKSSNKLVCKPYGRLSCMLAASPKLGGVYVFRTTSWNTISHITKAMEDIKYRCQGVLAGLPLTLVIHPRNVKPQGKDRSVVIYTVSLELHVDFAKFEQLSIAANILEMRKTSIKAIEDTRRQLAELGSEPETKEQAKEFVEEFVPETAGEETIVENGDNGLTDPESGKPIKQPTRQEVKKTHNNNKPKDNKTEETLPF